MVYKKGPKFKVRPVEEIVADLEEAAERYGRQVRSLFLPAGNTIAMPTPSLVAVLEAARRIFPSLQRVTVYGSSRYILEKGEADLARIARAGLTRVHVGLESGDDEVLRRIKKGAGKQDQIAAGRLLRAAGIENSSYVVLGIGGRERSLEHARQTAEALNAIEPDFVRLRTFVPKVNTPLLKEVERGSFVMLGPHEVLLETRRLIEALQAQTELVSDHYTNYVNLHGRLPQDKPSLLSRIDEALELDESRFRPFFVGTE
jgi:radical SAM superfamily enzyme YgiQ (UPF0313 family)